MSTDRELLELAAKAAGIILKWPLEGELAPRRVDDESWNIWSPLQDDGDALRLAILLEIKVAPPWTSGGYKTVQAVTLDGNETWEYAADQYAATRRAIVRAAAEIGRAMS